MDDRPTVRPYAAGDRAACRVLWAELTERHRELYDDPTIGGDDPGGDFDARHALAEAVWVAVAGGGVVRLAGLLLDEDGKAELEPVVVAAAWRGRGLGRLLAETVVSAARERGLRQLPYAPSAAIRTRSGSSTRSASTSSAASISGSTSSRARGARSSASPGVTFAPNS